MDEAFYDEAYFEMITNELKQKLANGNDHSFEQYVRDILCEVHDRGYDEGYIEGSADAIKQCGY